MTMTFNEWADFWRYEIGVNVIPADSKKKIPLVKWKDDPRGNWKKEPIPQKFHDEWKKKKMFDKGMAVICGQVFHNKGHLGKHLNGIDCDNKLGLDMICPNGIEKIAAITIVEQHANKNKGHIYFYTKEPIKSKVGNDGKNGTVPQIEIKSGGDFLLYCAGGFHKDNSPIEILGIDRVKTLDKETLEIRIDDICQEFDIHYLSDSMPKTLKPINKIIEPEFEIHEGENRSLGIARYSASKKIKNPEFDERVLFNLAMKYNFEHCRPPYDESKIKSLTKQALRYGEEKINNILKNEKEHNKTQSTIQVYNIGHQLIEKSVKSANDTEQVVIQVNIRNKSHWIDIFSSTFNQMVRIGTQKKYNKIHSDSIYTTAIKNIHASALLNGTEIRSVFNRCALDDGVLYYDLQDIGGKIFKISKNEIIESQNNDNIPIFLKSPSAKTTASIQQKPLFDVNTALDDFVKLCRIQKDDKIIFKSHVISYFLTGIPIPITILHGEQGSAKTSVSSAIKSLIDPEGECALSLPEKVDDLAVILSRHYISNFDNTENYSKDIAQFLCKAVTGTQHSKRQLFSNGEEFSIVLKSKIILNGISPSINQPDLLERSIFYELPKISKKERMTDADFFDQLNKLKPYVLGIVFMTIQKAMMIYDQVDKELKGKSLPRMASFAVWGEAISRSLGYEKNAFVEKYDEKIDDSNLSLSEEYPIIEPLIKFIGEKEKIVLPISELFSSIVDLDKKDERLPKDAKILGKQLKQLAPTFRTLDYDVITTKYNKRDGDYPRGSTIVKITKIVENRMDTYAN